MSNTDELLQRAYAPPLSGATPPRSRRGALFQPDSWRRAAFDVGFSEQHRVSLEVNPLTGRESYAVDGVEVLSTNSFWGPREFFVGTNEQHQVRFHVAWHGRISATVDGEKRHENLLPGLHLLFLGTVFALAIFLLSMFLGAALPGAPRVRPSQANPTAPAAVKTVDVAPPYAERQAISPPLQDQAPRRIR